MVFPVNPAFFIIRNIVFLKGKALLMQIRIKHYDQLTRDELYDILHLRAVVFNLGQQCPCVDPDGKDRLAWHLCLRHRDGTLAAYARIFGPDAYKPGYTAIGRVAVLEAYRGQGLGKRIMREALNFLRQRFPSVPVVISAQSYLQRFYEDLGFRRTGDEYLEEGIPHIRMEFHHQNKKSML